MTLPSSSVLVICLFLPFIKLCGKETIALQWPMFCSPYVVGGLVFAAALVHPRSLGGFAFALRVILWLTIALAAYLFAASISDRDLNSILALGSLAVTALLTWAVLARGEPEITVARCGVAAGVASTVWFAGIALSPDGLWGTTAGAVSAGAMAIGCAWWWYEAATAPHPPC